MKLALYLMFSLLFQCSNSSNNSHNYNLISQSCKEASKNDPNLSYDFCVASLTEASCKIQPPPNSLEDLMSISMKLTKSNATNIVSIISDLLKNQSFDQYAKACLKDCFDLFEDSISTLEDAMVAFESKDFDTANIKLSAALDDSVTCEDQFNDKEGEISPLTQENYVYFQLNVISLSFVQMIRQHY